VDADRELDEAGERRREDVLARIRRLSSPARRRPPDLAALTTELDALLTELEPLDPALEDVLRQEWWRIELLHVGWTGKIPLLSRRLLESRLRRVHTISRVDGAV
jgi:hypothetical protein